MKKTTLCSQIAYKMPWHFRLWWRSSQCYQTP